jgi:UDP-GlcNAc:undecaprenyl-phosphate GlcNAc-1-phosphate transferase
MLTLVTAFLIAGIVNLFLIRFAYVHDGFSGDLLTGPQKVHSGVVPRIGGVGILCGMLAGGAVLLFRPLNDKPELIFQLLLISLPAFVCGLVEDLTKRIPPWARLLGAVVTAVLGVVFLGAVIHRVGIPGLDKLLLFWPLSFMLTAFAVAGMAHAVNIVDGFNGLSAGIALLILLALAYVAFKVYDLAVFHICLAAAGAILGFLIWNYPAGLIFLGDGGAYLVGAVIAEAAVLLVVRHPQVSPWFPLLVVIYPVFETLYTIYRRAFVRGQSPGSADALHLHSLIYRRLLSWMLSSKLEARLLVRRNAVTAPYLWGLTCLCIIPAMILYKDTYFLMGFVVLFACFYIWLYTCIVKFRTPVWLRRLFMIKHYQSLSAK